MLLLFPLLLALLGTTHSAAQALGPYSITSYTTARLDPKWYSVQRMLKVRHQQVQSDAYLEYRAGGNYVRAGIRMLYDSPPHLFCDYLEPGHKRSTFSATQLTRFRYRSAHLETDGIYVTLMRPANKPDMVRATAMGFDYAEEVTLCDAQMGRARLASSVANIMTFTAPDSVTLRFQDDYVRHTVTPSLARDDPLPYSFRVDRKEDYKFLHGSMSNSSNHL
ncbi:hypothetical protein RI367_008106 [Sorochytrium milnesiophthora]